MPGLFVMLALVAGTACGIAGLRRRSWPGLGPAPAGQPPRWRNALIVAVLGAALSAAMLRSSGYGIFFLAPFCCGGLAALTAAAAGRWPVVFGMCGAAALLVPFLAWSCATYSPDQVKAYGNPFFDRFTLICWGFALAGGLAVDLAWRFAARRSLPNSGDPLDLR